MTAALAERPTPAAPRPGDPRRAMLALARTEGVRLLRHPAVIAGLLLFTGPEIHRWLTGRANRFPVLQDEDWSTQFLALLVLGGGALIAANLAALRADRHATTGLYDTLVLPPAWRTGAFLLAVLPFTLLVAVLTATRIALLAALPGSAGRPDPAELALHPAVVLLFGAAGVLLARLVRTVIVAPLLLLAAAVAVYAAGLSLPGHVRWLLPVALEQPPMPVPVALTSRPSGWHLAYVAGLIVLVALAAPVAAGARSRRLVMAGVAALSVTAGAGAAQYLPVGDAVRDARATAAERPAEMQDCRSTGPVTYCAFGDFGPWTGDWDTVVRGVLRGVPAEAAGRPLVIRQRVSMVERMADGQVVTAEEQAAAAAEWQRIDPGAVTVGTRWGDGRSEMSLAGLVAYQVVTHETAPAHIPVCGARGVLVAWLAGQATPETAAGLRAVDATSWGGVPFGDMQFPVGFSVPDREMAAASALLRRPSGDVAATVARSWAELTAAGTSADRAGELLGVPVPPLPPVEERIQCDG
ncbi:hypothetical protein KZ829_13755 [Actinoplanes hulinensis]|uniref:ABC transporter permease n=1 Tax=Actinoplanes hulinensis TaxID=1144547 RepID=A0ABS7B194_9ACTN|nr:hypothetical protein [Actinoplanes hulinensis]MBW6434804.1 hypothetical protein [Actinoplanes hulinensis]